jgi:hypothetical protein
MVGVKRLQVMGCMPVAKHLHVAVMLHNIYSVFYGGQAAAMFGHQLRAGLTLQTYLARA